MPSVVGSWVASVGSCVALVGSDGGTGGMFGMTPALAEPVRSRKSRQIPRVLRIAFPFEVMEVNQSRRRILLRYGGFAALDKNLSAQRKGCLT